METISRNLATAMSRAHIDNAEMLAEALKKQGVSANKAMISGWMQLDEKRVKALCAVLRIDASNLMAAKQC